MLKPTKNLHIAVCASCEQPLQGGQVLLALGEQWHVWCFKCSECAAVLQGEYMAHEGKPLCIRDYNLKYGVRCYECDKYIAGKVLQVGHKIIKFYMFITMLLYACKL